MIGRRPSALLRGDGERFGYPIDLMNKVRRDSTTKARLI